MINEIKIVNKVKVAIAEIMATYGDNPEQFAIHMEKLIIEWFVKGITIGTEQEKRRQEIEKS